MFNSKPKHSYGDFFEGMLIGTSLGAITTYLMGTEKGKKLRKDWFHKYQKIEHKIEKRIKKAAKSPTAKKIKRMAKKAVAKKLHLQTAKRRVKRRIKRRRKR